MTLNFTAPVPVSQADRDAFLQFAIEAAVAAGSATLPYFRTRIQVDNKLADGGFDPVTAADRAAETVLRELIGERFPAHGVFGEEFGHKSGNGLTWVIDPVDGTRAFMAGMVHWGLLLGLFDGERPIIGVMYQPFTEELFFGDCVSAGYRRGTMEQTLQVRNCGELNDAVLTTTSPKLFAPGSERDGFDALESSVKLSRYGGDCYIYAMLAMGYVDLACDAALNAYDIQALIPIIEGAGGVVSTLDGGSAAMGGTVLAAGNASLHKAALQIMNA
jgi:histidinol phosphatase-like enzyme (inositol monophosphatase family)